MFKIKKKESKKNDKLEIKNRKLEKEKDNSIEINGIYDEDNYEQVIKHYEKILKTDPKNKHALIRLGETYLEMENYDRSMRCYNKALEIDPDKPDIWNGMGHIHEANGNYEDALNCYGNAAESGKPWFFYDLGRLLEREGDYDAAAESYETVLIDYPYDIEVRKKLADLYERQENFIGAINHYLFIEDMDGFEEGDWEKLGSLFEADGDYNEALKYYNRSLEMNPNYKSIKKKIENIKNKKI